MFAHWSNRTDVLINANNVGLLKPPRNNDKSEFASFGVQLIFL
jgi:hypothetical protein